MNLESAQPTQHKTSPSGICLPHPDGSTSCWDAKDLSVLVDAVRRKKINVKKKEKKTKQKKEQNLSLTTTKDIKLFL